jgi:hypothetical protein
MLGGQAVRAGAATVHKGAGRGGELVGSGAYSHGGGAQPAAER